MEPVTFVCTYFDGGDRVSKREYNPSYVDRLYRGIARNVTVPFRFVCMTHHNASEFESPVETVMFNNDSRDWWCINEVFRPELNVGRRGIWMGLDTVLVGSLDEFCSYEGEYALPLVPQSKAQPDEFANGIVFYNERSAAVMWDMLNTGRMSLTKKSCMYGGQPSEMLFMRRYPAIDSIDHMYPGAFLSYKRQVVGKSYDRSKLRAIGFHGRPFVHESLHDHLIAENWV